MDNGGEGEPIVACNEGVIQKKGRAPLNLAPIKALLRVNTIGTVRTNPLEGEGQTEGGREEGRKGRCCRFRFLEKRDPYGCNYTRANYALPPSRGASTRIRGRSLHHTIVIIYEAYKGGGGGKRGLPLVRRGYVVGGL